MADDIVSQYYLANALRQGQRQSTRSLLAQRMMGNALDTSPTTPLGALARALTGVVSAYTMRQAEEGDRLDQKQALASLMDRDQQQQDEAAQWSARMNGQGAQPPAGGAAPAPAPVMREALPGIGAPAPQGAPAGAFSPVAMRSLVGQESAGDPNARPIDRQTGQPRSSALGQAQFIAPTWLAFAGANPNLFHGLDLNTPAGRNAALARRTDPALTEPAVQWYAGQNAQALQQAGLPVTDASLAAAHALGPAGAIGVLRAAPDTPLSRVLSPAAIQANPQYGRMTAGQFVSDYGARYAPRGSVVQFAGPGAPTGPAAGTVEGSAPGDVQATLEALRQGQGAPGAAAAGGGALPPSVAAAAPPAPAVDMALLQQGLASNNPRIQRAAQAQLQALQLQRQTESERRAEAAAGRAADAAARQAGAAERQAAAAGRGPLPRGMQLNPQTGQLEDIPGMPREPFSGDSIDAQASNVMLRIGPRIANGTASDQERQQYALAHSHLTAPSLQQVPVDPNDPSKGMALAMVPRRAPDGFPAPDFRPQAPAASGVPGAALPQQQGSPGAGNPPATQGAGPGSQGSPAPGGAQIIPGTARGQAPLTEAQGRANMFGSQMRMGDDIIRSVQIPSGTAQALWRHAPEMVVNLGLSTNDQQYFNAVRLFAAGVLRRETGAAFTQRELEDVQSRFFPMPGDSQQVITQKAAARQQMISSMQAEIPGGLRGAVPTPSGGAATGPATHRWNPQTGQIEAVN